MVRQVWLAALIAFLPVTAGAVQPDEVLDDPALEERARAISAELRCVVCQSESIDESNASIARDLRLLVRERLVAGDSDAEAVNFIVARYGEYVLMRPPFTMSNAALWLSGPIFLLLGGGIAFAFIRSRSKTVEVRAAPLSPEEQQRIQRLDAD
ncbi:MAG: cytochrome c-type biogenesis protein [Pseudomonadota bacterium]